MFEDPNCGARQASTQHQRRVIQLIAQNETTLKQEKERIAFKTHIAMFFFFLDW